MYFHFGLFDIQEPNTSTPTQFVGYANPMNNFEENAFISKNSNFSHSVKPVVVVNLKWLEVNWNTTDPAETDPSIGLPNSTSSTRRSEAARELWQV
jgi:hypothetical protein